MVAFLAARRAGCIDNAGEIDDGEEGASCAGTKSEIQRNVDRLTRACGVSRSQAYRLLIGMP